MVRHRLHTFLSLPLLAIPAVAVADEPVMPPVGASRAVFPTMGPDGSASQIGAQLLIMNGDGGGDALKRLDVNGQFVSASGAGGYITVGASALDDEVSLGSLEVGALFRRATGTSDVAMRAGIVLPTGTSNDTGFPMHLISTAYSRPSDYLTGLPDSTSLRVAVTPSLHRGSLVARADIGLDMVVAGDGTEFFDSPFLHVDLGAGVSNAKGAALVELTTMSYLEEPDELIHIIAFTGELVAGKTTPYVTISRPFTSGTEDIELTNFAIGLRGQL